MVELHPLSPFLPEKSRLLMLGSFPPPRSRWCMDFFYPNYINDMWRIFGIVFMNDKNAFVNTKAKTFAEEKIRNLLNEKGIAIYDTASKVNRLNNNASDKFLEILEPTDILRLASAIPLCKAIVTTGGKAAEETARQLGVQIPLIAKPATVRVNGREMQFWRMPSSSRAYPLALEKKAEYYRTMFLETGIATEK